jgi:hypothetical protein
MIKVLPKDGYGKAYIEKVISKPEIAPEFTITTERSKFEDSSTSIVQKNLLAEQGKNIAVGQTLT